MSRGRYFWLACRAWIELVRYDMIHACTGGGRVQLPNTGLGAPGPVDSIVERAICDAVVLACCFYWKRVLCLQRSTCATRLLRAYGIRARLVIGYRPRPFFSHAWVEVDGRVVNDSPVYRQRLRILLTA
jgi:hypothetical protein